MAHSQRKVPAKVIAHISTEIGGTVSTVLVQSVALSKDQHWWITLSISIREESTICHSMSSTVCGHGVDEPPKIHAEPSLQMIV